MEDFQKLVWSCFRVSHKYANLFETRTKHRIEWWNAKTLTLPPLSQVCEDWSLQSLGRLLLGELDGPFGSWLVVEGGCGFLVLADLFWSVLVLVLAFSCCECAHYESLICIQSWRKVWITATNFNYSWCQKWLSETLLWVGPTWHPNELDPPSMCSVFGCKNPAQVEVSSLKILSAHKIC